MLNTTSMFSAPTVNRREAGLQIPRLSLCLMWSCLLLALGGCQPSEQPAQGPPVSYQSLCGITREQFDAMDEESLRQWIQIGHGEIITMTSLPDEALASGVTAYGWVDPDRSDVPAVAYLRDGHLVRISYMDLVDGATFGQVAEALMAPESVYGASVEIGQVSYYVGLDYFGLGVVVQSHGIGGRSSLLHEGRLMVQLTKGLRVKRVDCFAPGSVDRVLHQAFFLSEDTITLEMRRRTNWQGFGAYVGLDNNP